MDYASPLAPLDVFDTEGTPVSFSSLWAERPVALVFLRQYG